MSEEGQRTRSSRWSHAPRESGKAGHRAKGSRHSGHQKTGGRAICPEPKEKKMRKCSESSRNWTAGCGESYCPVRERWAEFHC